MIDFHNHVLHDVDDGPKTIEESMKMLSCASAQGITDIVQTVLFQHPKMEGKSVDYDYLLSKVKEIQMLIDKNNLNIKMHLSAEVFYLPNLVEISSNPLVTIGNSKYMLIEFSTNIFPTGYDDEIFKLQMHGINPIIAHPERYRFVQKDIKILEKWIGRDYVIQIDAGSILGHFGNKVKKISYRMIEEGYIHLIGSDAHNNKKRNFCIKEAYDLLKTDFSSIVDILKHNSCKILKGESVIHLEKENKDSRLRSFMFKLLRRI